MAQTDEARRRTASELAEYLLELGGTLLSYGCASHRLEGLIREIAREEGFVAEVFAVPTGLWMSIARPGDAPAVRLRRVPEWGTDLARLAEADRIFNDVLERRYDLAEARRRITALRERRPAYPAVLRYAAQAGTAGASAVFFDGGAREVGVAALGGLLVAALGVFLARTERARRLHDFLGGLVAGIVASLAAAYVPGISRQVVVLSIVILLVPGMALTTGLEELTHRNLVSGASKLMEVMIVLLSIVFGIAAAVGLERALGFPAGRAVALVSQPVWAQVAALGVAAVCVSMMFAVPRKLLVAATLAYAVGWAVTSGTRLWPGPMSVFVASCAVSLVANGAARITNRPAQVFILPALVLLVPGSFGFLSLEAFLRGELLGGAAKGFEMLLVASAIVTGLLIANVVLPSRKLL